MKTFNVIKITWLFFLSLFFVSTVSADQPFSAQKSGSLFDHWQEAEILNVNLELDFEKMLENKRSNTYQPAVFSYTDKEGNVQSWQIKTRVRGRFRRMKCEMPPLKLQFPKKELKSNGFKKHNDFKLVTHCLEGKEGNDNVLREYLAYELYNLVSKQSLRTQLVKITYNDNKSKSKTIRYGILIEDTDEMAKRLDGAVCKDCYNTPANQFQQENLNIHSMFQYMIGNSDWSVSMVKNLKILQSKKDSSYILVPYDFDFSGFVNASYAVPNPDYNLKSVRERVLIGAGPTPEQFESTIGHFPKQKIRNIRADQFF